MNHISVEYDENFVNVNNYG